MAILEVDVPQDISNFKKRVVGPFTVRQAATCGIAATLDIALLCVLGTSSLQNFWPVYLFLDGIVLMFQADPFPGIKMEKYLLMFVRYNFLTPKVRTLQMPNALMENQIKAIPLNKKELSKHPEYKIYS